MLASAAAAGGALRSGGPATARALGRAGRAPGARLAALTAAALLQSFGCSSLLEALRDNSPFSAAAHPLGSDASSLQPLSAALQSLEERAGPLVPAVALAWGAWCALARQLPHGDDAQLPQPAAPQRPGGVADAPGARALALLASSPALRCRGSAEAESGLGAALNGLLAVRAALAAASAAFALHDGGQGALVAVVRAGPAWAAGQLLDAWDAPRKEKALSAELEVLRALLAAADDVFPAMPEALLALLGACCASGGRDTALQAWSRLATRPAAALRCRGDELPGGAHGEQVQARGGGGAEDWPLAVPAGAWGALRRGAGAGGTDLVLWRVPLDGAAWALARAAAFARAGPAGAPPAERAQLAATLRLLRAALAAGGTRLAAAALAPPLPRPDAHGPDSLLVALAAGADAAVALPPRAPGAPQLAALLRALAAAATSAPEAVMRALASTAAFSPPEGPTLAAGGARPAAPVPLSAAALPSLAAYVSRGGAAALPAAAGACDVLRGCAARGALLCGPGESLLAFAATVALPAAAQQRRWRAHAAAVGALAAACAAPPPATLAWVEPPAAAAGARARAALGQLLAGDADVAEALLAPLLALSDAHALRIRATPHGDGGDAEMADGNEHDDVMVSYDGNTYDEGDGDEEADDVAAMCAAATAVAQALPLLLAAAVEAAQGGRSALEGVLLLCARRGGSAPPGVAALAAAAVSHRSPPLLAAAAAAALPAVVAAASRPGGQHVALTAASLGGGDVAREALTAPLAPAAAHARPAAAAAAAALLAGAAAAHPALAEWLLEETSTAVEDTTTASALTDASGGNKGVLASLWACVRDDTLPPRAAAAAVGALAAAGGGGGGSSGPEALLSRVQPPSEADDEADAAGDADADDGHTGAGAQRWAASACALRLLADSAYAGARSNDEDASLRAALAAWGGDGGEGCAARAWLRAACEWRAPERPAEAACAAAAALTLRVAAHRLALGGPGALPASLGLDAALAAGADALAQALLSAPEAQALLRGAEAPGAAAAQLMELVADALEARRGDGSASGSPGGSPPGACGSTRSSSDTWRASRAAAARLAQAAGAMGAEGAALRRVAPGAAHAAPPGADYPPPYDSAWLAACAGDCDDDDQEGLPAAAMAAARVVAAAGAAAAGAAAQRDALAATRALLAAATAARRGPLRVAALRGLAAEAIAALRSPAVADDSASPLAESFAAEVAGCVLLLARAATSADGPADADAAAGLAASLAEAAAVALAQRCGADGALLPRGDALAEPLLAALLCLLRAAAAGKHADAATTPLAAAAPPMVALLCGALGCERSGPPASAALALLASPAAQLLPAGAMAPLLRARLALPPQPPQAAAEAAAAHACSVARLVAALAAAPGGAAAALAAGAAAPLAAAARAFGRGAQPAGGASGAEALRASLQALAALLAATAGSADAAPLRAAALDVAVVLGESLPALLCGGALGGGDGRGVVSESALASAAAAAHFAAQLARQAGPDWELAAPGALRSCRRGAAALLGAAAAPPRPPQQPRRCVASGLDAPAAPPAAAAAAWFAPGALAGTGDAPRRSAAAVVTASAACAGFLLAAAALRPPRRGAAEEDGWPQPHTLAALADDAEALRKQLGAGERPAARNMGHHPLLRAAQALHAAAEALTAVLAAAAGPTTRAAW